MLSVELYMYTGIYAYHIPLQQIKYTSMNDK